MICVYEILVDGVRRYVGITNDMKRRTREHVKAIDKDQKKYLYKKIRELENPKIEFNVIATYDKKMEAARMEALIILKDYFRDKQLYQSPPFSFKYF